MGYEVTKSHQKYWQCHTDYSVLVTNSNYELKAIGQLYRDRADCENGFDELKNQWGWGGYTTQRHRITHGTLTFGMPNPRQRPSILHSTLLT